MGLFEDIHGAESPRVFAEELKARAARIYGTPLRAFLNHLVRDYDALLPQADSFMAGLVKDELPLNAAAEVGRALRRVALVAAAGEMATSMGITGWEPDEARRAALRCFGDWITARGGIGQADIEAGIWQVREFLEAHGSSRFQSMIARHERGGTKTEERVIERAGHWRDNENGI